MLSVEKTLKQEIAQWKHEYEVLDACCELAQGKIAELKAENERLKEEIKYLEEEKKEKIQLLEQIIKILYPNASDDELFTVTFNSEYIDKLNNLQQTLQEIKDIIHEQLMWQGQLPQCELEILRKLTKAEEE